MIKASLHASSAPDQYPPVGEDGEQECTEGVSRDGEGEDGGDGGGVVAHEVEEADRGLRPAALVVVPAMFTSWGFVGCCS